MITPERWADFFSLVRDTRRLQQIYRRTMDPMIRRELGPLEDLLDATIAGIDEDLEVLPAALEGGVA